MCGMLTLSTWNLVKFTILFESWPAWQKEHRQQKCSYSLVIVRITVPEPKIIQHLDCFAPFTPVLATLSHPRTPKDNTHLHNKVLSVPGCCQDEIQDRGRLLVCTFWLPSLKIGFRIFSGQLFDLISSRK